VEECAPTHLTMYLYSYTSKTVHIYVYYYECRLGLQVHSLSVTVRCTWAGL
jgi:hypothetical protein